MLKLVGVSKIHVAGEVQTTALDRIDLDIDAGEYVAITGPSGCGKSTLLSVLGLLDVPNSGEYWFEGQNVAGWSEAKLNQLRRGRVGFIFQSFNLIEELSVFENVELALEYTGTPKAERHARVNAMLTRLGIAHRATHRPSQLSGGQQQRVAIARALVAGPAMLLADEPTGNLDTAHGDEVMRLLRTINAEGTTVVMVTHSPAHASQASRTLHLLDGRIVVDALQAAFDMKIRDFRIGWRLLAKEPAYSAVVILGLTIGFAVCFLLLGLVRHSFSYDEQVPDSDNIYTIKQKWNVPGTDDAWYSSTSLPVRDALLASGLPLKATAFISRHIDVRVGAQVHGIGISVVDPDFQAMFQPPVIKGDLKAALTRPDAIALTRASAVKLFGHEDVVGKSVQIAGAPYLVSALLADQPSASTMPFTALTGSGTAIWNAEYRKMVTTNWGSSHGSVFIKLGQGVQPAAVLDAITRAMHASSFYTETTPAQRAALGGKDFLDFRLGPLHDIYLDPDTDRPSTTHGDRNGVLGLAAVGLLILLLAATNYVNLATVRTLRRQREIAVRKVLGASASAVSRQFLAESVLVCLIATAAGLLLAWLLQPAFSDLVQREFDNLFSPAALLASVLLGVLLGVAAGAYPTWSALRVRATSALAGRGNVETAGGLWLRRVLTVLQFATAMGLTGMTLAVAWQTRHASALDPGFEHTGLLIVSTSSDMRNANTSAFRDALARLPGVTSVGVSDAPVTVNQNSTSMQRDGGSPLGINYLLVDPGFFDTYGLKAAAGRLYSVAKDKASDNDKVVLNQAGARKLGFASAEDAVGKYIREPEGAARQVVGVVPDIRHRSARDEMQATIYMLSPRTGVFTLRTSGDMEAVQRAVEALWPRFFPNDVISMQRADTMFAENYADDLRLAKLLAASSVIAVAIAAFGIYVLSAYSVQRRIREIVLRKLYGASGGAIGRLVAREFAVLIGVGAAIGLPVAWVAGERYLAAFTERAPIGLWTVGAALGVAVAVALGATLRHTLSAVRLAPALALRD